MWELHVLKALDLPSRGMNVEDAGNDEGVGAEDGQDGGKDVKCTKA